MAGGGACAGAGPRRAEAREGLWTRSRRPRRGRAGDAWRGVAAAAGPWALAGDLATVGGRRGHAMPAAAHHRYAGRDGGVASGIAANSARGRAGCARDLVPVAVARSGGGPARRRVLYSCRPVRRLESGEHGQGKGKGTGNISPFFLIFLLLGFLDLLDYLVVSSEMFWEVGMVYIFTRTILIMEFEVLRLDFD